MLLLHHQVGLCTIGMVAKGRAQVLNLIPPRSQTSTGSCTNRVVSKPHLFHIGVVAPQFVDQRHYSKGIHGHNKGITLTFSGCYFCTPNNNQESLTKSLPLWTSFDAHVCLFKCQERSRKHFSALWSYSEIHAWLVGCKIRLSRFNHCGSPVCVN